MNARIQQSFDKLSEAFSVLANVAKRIEYDGSLAGGKPSPMIEKPPEPARPAPDEAISIRSNPGQKQVYTEGAARASADNRRRCERFRLSIPARVTGHDRRSGKWTEMAETVDVSRTGLTLRMRRRLRHGMVVYLTLPLPAKLRTHGYTDPSFGVYALVRRVEPPRKGVRYIGFEFMGEHPPAGYLEKPWATFRTRQWSGGDRRRKRRESRKEVVELEYFNESLQLLGRETAQTENISRGGCRACVRMPPAEFEVVRVSFLARGFESLAVVSNRFNGNDGFVRLCLRFIDTEWQI
jgi:hypothetical protein